MNHIQTQIAKYQQFAVKLCSHYARVLLTW